LATTYFPDIELQPACAESLPSAPRVSEICESGAMVYVPVTLVAMNLVSWYAAGSAVAPPFAEPDVDEPAAEEPALDEAADDELAPDAAAELLPAAGGDVLLLAHAVSPASSAIAAAAPNSLFIRIVVLTCAMPSFRRAAAL
jgi:hypothetical protein